METVAECVCCRDYPAAVRKQQGRQSCVTSHPDFEGLCLDPGVLQLACSTPGSDVRGHITPA